LLDIVYILSIILVKWNSRRVSCAVTFKPGLLSTMTDDNIDLNVTSYDIGLCATDSIASVGKATGCTVYICPLHPVTCRVLAACH